MKKIITLSSILILLGHTYFNVAQAGARNAYIGISAGSADTSFDGIDEDFDLDGITLQLGVWMTDNASLEARMGKGNGDDSIGSLDLELESLGGLYGTYHWFLGDQVAVYGIAGWSTASVKLSGDNGSIQDDDNGFSYGAGILLSIFTVEYMRLLDTTDVEVDVVSVGLRYTFD